MIIIKEGFSVFEKVQECLAKGVSCVLCTVIDSEGSTPVEAGAKMVVLPDGTITGTVGGGIGEYRSVQKAREMIEKGIKTSLFHENLDAKDAAEEGAVCGGSITIFLERITATPEVVIFGGGHVGKAVLKAISFLGWKGIIWDDREEFTSIPPECLPHSRSICCPLENVFEQGLRLHENSFILIATRGHALDSDVVRILEKEPGLYYGMIGSRNKIRSVREKLAQEGIALSHLDRIHQPVGVPLNAQTPEEIALSIVAEMVGVYRSAPLENLRINWGETAITPQKSTS